MSLFDKCAGSGVTPGSAPAPYTSRESEKRGPGAVAWHDDHVPQKRSSGAPIASLSSSQRLTGASSRTAHLAASTKKGLQQQHDAALPVRKAKVIDPGPQQRSLRASHCFPSSSSKQQQQQQQQHSAGTMVAADSASWAGLTRSSQASTSAATLESFLDTAASLVSQAAPKLDTPPIARFSPGARTTAASASTAAAISNPTEVARARAYQQVHSSDSSTTTPSYTSTVSSSSYKDEHEDEGEHHAHTATNHAFLITYFVAGGAAGATSRTVVSPLERLKIIMQVQPQSSKAASSAKGKLSSTAKNRAYGGVWTGLVKMWQEEGFAGFMRGNGINCLRIAPYSAVQFTTYELCKSWLRNGDGDLDVVRKLGAGAVAGIASVVSTYPLDLVRSRISIASANMYNEAKSEATSQVSAKVSQEVLREQIAARQKAVPGIWQMTSKVYREEGGLRGLYRGCVPTSIGVAPYVALNFYFYEAARKRITPLDGSEPSALMKLACGALAGSISQTVTYPLDVLRRRMQVAGMKDSQERLGYKDKNAINAIQNILKAEGITGLYRGLLPNLLKVAPSIGTSFLTYEAVKGFLEVHFDELHPPTPKETSTH